MVAFLIFFTILGAASAIDLTGCRPKRPKEITGLRQLTGDIYSPGYLEKENYPDNLLCQTIIRAPFGFRIKLEFKDIDVEVADLCMNDAVEILDISQEPPIGLGRFCGNQTYPPIVSVGNSVVIVFLSDYIIGKGGFRLHYQLTSRPALCQPGQRVCKNRQCYDNAKRCDGEDDCGDGTDEENCGLPLEVTDCGLREVTGLYGQDRIVGGREAEPGSWPWQADLQLSFIYPNGHTCGGTLINAQWILTAAHCFMQFKIPEAWRVHLGSHNKYKNDEGEQVRYVDQIILYPGLTGLDLLRLRDVDMKHDMALMKLNAPVKFSKSVRPACLPSQGYELAEGTKCMASGWGMTRGTGSSHALKEVELSVQKGEVCTGDMGPIDNTTMICVKNSKGFQDVCHGDSGGPLVCEQKGKWHIMGATSYGNIGNYEGGLCALPGSASVYSKVSHKTEWIKQQIEKYS